MNQQKLPLELIDPIIELYSNGRIEEAIEAIEALNKDYPNEPLLINISGVCYQAQGFTNRALESYQHAIRIKPDYVDALYNLGNIFREDGQLDDAIKSYEKVIGIKPDYDDAQFNLGVSLQILGQVDKAIDHYEMALLSIPNNTGIRINLGCIFQSLGNPEDAIEEYKKVLEINPNHNIALNNLGACLKEIGDMHQAIECFEKALETKPDYADVYYNLGYVFQDLGQFDKAIYNYERAVSINNYPMAYHSLSQLKKYKPDDTQIIQMVSLLKSDNLSQSEKINICFALANIYEKFENQVEFFNYLSEGNILQKNESSYSIVNTKNEHNAIRKMFQKPLPLALYSNSYPSSKKNLIFIVGMPRSGTSLVEQIISSHRSVYGAGELDTLTKLASPIINNFILGDIDQVTEQALTFIRNKYLDKLDQLNTEDKVITDKLPLNFQYIGFILSAFPEAKIVHLKRDARAICWSNYKYYFDSKNNGYSNNFEDLIGFYKLYDDLMSFWHDLYPSKIYDLSYENLTINQEDETRKLLEYCDLDWDENCLNFHTNERAVKTISSLQVRQKMYQGSSKDWKKYRAYIKPLIDGLKNY